MMFARRLTPALRAVTAVAMIGALAPAAAQTPPTLDLATAPLLGRTSVHPNVLISLSVEFPTVGAGYRATPYAAGTRYTGYFNPDLCYTYNTTEERFEPASAVTNAAANDRSCDGSMFSGNLMNWATMSAMDVFRFVMTGGRRVVDSKNLTVLERSWVPIGEYTGVANFYATNNNWPRRFVGTSYTSGNDRASVAPSTVLPFSVSRLSLIGCRNDLLVGNWENIVRQTSGSTSSGATTITLSSTSGISVGMNVSHSRIPAGTVITEISGSTITLSAATTNTIGNNSDIAFNGGSPNCDTPLADGRFASDPANMVRRYKVRVLVCDALDRDTTHGRERCFNYGTASDPSWKPIGEVQKRAEGMRFGVFGYLLDQVQSRYGGVLRHPLGYVGQRVYDDFFRDSGANTAREWDADGVFLANPLNITPRSGFVNYLNNFGSVDPVGGYKRHDTAGEMFYEAVRYLQWHKDGPTAKATSGITDAMRGGFPVYTDWSADPLVCPQQKNFIISISDHNTWNDWEIPGNTRNDGANDAARAVDTDYNLDIVALTNEARTQAVARGMTTALPNPLAPTLTGAGASASYFIAGLAWYGQNYDIRPAGARTDDPNAADKQGFTTISIDVMEGGGVGVDQRQLHVAGRVGSDDPATSNYMQAGNPNRLVQSIREAFGRIDGSSGAVGGGALTAATLVPGETGVFAPYYSPATWTGELEFYKFEISSTTPPTVSLKSAPEWKASTKLPAPGSRKIFLGSADGSGVEFTWANLTADQQTRFNTNPVTFANDGLGERRLAWLRGSRADEQTDTNADAPFRSRGTGGVLGAIVSSEPAYVGAPDSKFTFSGYTSFISANTNRRKMVYAGTNNGMVHGFDVATGIEQFAYIPSAVLGRLPAITEPGYRNFPLVDTPLVAEDFFDGTNWRTVLVGGFGAGVQGLFALDVTQPDKFGASSILWEFTDKVDADMGHVIGRPIVAPVRVGGSIKWFVIVASGVNNHLNDGNANSTGQGALFFLDLAKPAGTAWSLNTNYWKITTPVSVTSAKPGLSQPSAVFDLSGVVTTLYAGDLQGNLWRFNISDSNPANWSIWHGTSTARQPLFTATSGSTRQPITTQPVIAFAPGGGYLVLVGTGKLLENGDSAGPFSATQSFYAVRDDGTNTVTRSDLEARTVNSSTGAITGASFSYGTTTGTRRGWVMDYPRTTAGEMQVSPGLLAFGSLFFNSVMPGQEACKLGNSARYCVNPVTGLASASCSTARSEPNVGYLSSPTFLQVALGDSGVGTKGSAVRTTTFALVDFATGRQVITAGDPVQVSGPLQSSTQIRRISWRELVNWREERN